MENIKPPKPPIETKSTAQNMDRQIEIARITGNKTALAIALEILKNRRER